MSEKMVPMKLGDTKVLGEKEYDLHDDGLHLLMQVATAEGRSYSRVGLLADKKRLEAELAEVISLIAEIDQRLAARVADPEPV